MRKPDEQPFLWVLFGRTNLEFISTIAGILILVAGTKALGIW